MRGGEAGARALGSIPALAAGLTSACLLLGLPRGPALRGHISLGSGNAVSPPCSFIRGGGRARPNAGL